MADDCALCRRRLCVWKWSICVGMTGIILFNVLTGVTDAAQEDIQQLSNGAVCNSLPYTCCPQQMHVPFQSPGH